MPPTIQECLAKWRWGCLLGFLLAAMFFSAAASVTDLSHVFTLVLYAAVFSGTLCAASLPTALRFGGLALVSVWLILGVALVSDHVRFAGPVFILLTSCVLVGCLLVTVSELARNRETGLDPILGAVFGYILIGVTWSLLYTQIEIDTPGSFNLPSEQTSSSEFIYFSLVTLTSLGYGDITPATPIPRLLAGIQAAVGTIYIAVFIGQIVGRFRD